MEQSSKSTQRKYLCYRTGAAFPAQLHCLRQCCQSGVGPPRNFCANRGGLGVDGLEAAKGARKEFPLSGIEARWVKLVISQNGLNTDEYNLDLSKRRAQSVVSWLVGHGIAANRLTAQGFGKNNPVADNVTAQGRALNRRVEIAVVP